jgi:hypothetical protein
MQVTVVCKQHAEVPGALGVAKLVGAAGGRDGCGEHVMLGAAEEPSDVVHEHGVCTIGRATLGGAFEGSKRAGQVTSTFHPQPVAVRGVGVTLLVSDWVGAFFLLVDPHQRACGGLRALLVTGLLAEPHQVS